MAAPAHTTGLVYDDLAGFPDDNLRRELIGGELVVTPAPRVRHQRAVRRLTVALDAHAERHGGEVFPAPLDVLLTDADVVEPDVLYVAPGNLDRIGDRFLRGAPDIAVEVSSPSTRRLELVRKRELYERHGVPEYWYVDLDVDRVELYRLDEHGRYPVPVLLGRGDVVTSPLLPGLELAVDDVLGPPE
jgi:Uma2 family endonuclease